MIRVYLCFECGLFFFFLLFLFFFFFQAEDGIRDIGVTGVQTCALPILQLQQWQDDYDREVMSKGNR